MLVLLWRVLEPCFLLVFPRYVPYVVRWQGESSQHPRTEEQPVGGTSATVREDTKAVEAQLTITTTAAP